MSTCSEQYVIYEIYLVLATLLNDLNKIFLAFQKNLLLYGAVFVPDWRRNLFVACILLRHCNFEDKLSWSVWWVGKFKTINHFKKFNIHIILQHYSFLFRTDGELYPLTNLHVSDCFLTGTGFLEVDLEFRMLRYNLNLHLD